MLQLFHNEEETGLFRQALSADLSGLQRTLTELFRSAQGILLSTFHRTGQFLEAPLSMPSLQQYIYAPYTRKECDHLCCFMWLQNC